MDAYIATEDFTGLCPVLQLQPTSRADPQWQVMRAICATFGGGSGQGLGDLDRLSQAARCPGSTCCWPRNTRARRAMAGAGR
jgi:hypothetical protein